MHMSWRCGIRHGTRREGERERGQRRNIRHAKHAVILTMRRLGPKGVNVLIDGQAQTQHIVSSSEGGRGRTAPGKRQRAQTMNCPRLSSCGSTVHRGHTTHETRGVPREGSKLDCTRQVTPEAQISNTSPPCRQGLRKPPAQALGHLSKKRCLSRSFSRIRNRRGSTPLNSTTDSTTVLHNGFRWPSVPPPHSFPRNQ